MKILFLVLFFLIMSLSCKQNPRSMLSSPPIVDDKITNSNTGSSNTNSGNTDGGNTGSGSNSGYGYYDVYILENGTDIKTVKYRISDTDKLLKAYSNMIIDSKSGKPRFELSKNSNPNPPDTTTETYTFDTNNLNLIKKEANKNAGTSTVSKKFRGVCLVRIYPDATTKTANSSLLGNYTIAGIYEEIEGNKTIESTGVTGKPMTKSDNFQNTGYDELIILRTDEPTTDTATKNTNYRADILFNDYKGIKLYDYNPDRTFMKQNTNFIFKRETTQQ